MHVDVFLTQLFGLYFIIMGTVISLRKRSIMPAMKEMVNNKGLLYAFSALELVAGLSVVLVYPNVSWKAVGIISLVGYMMVVESLIYLAAPVRIMQSFIKFFNKPDWYTASGAISLALGIYLTVKGFGIL